MEENKDMNVPYIVYEAAQAKAERTEKRLVIALVVLICVLFLSNIAWLWAWNQYDYVSEETQTTSTVDVDAKDGVANYIGNNGDIVNGTDKSDEKDSDEETDQEEEVRESKGNED